MITFKNIENIMKYMKNITLSLQLDIVWSYYFVNNESLRIASINIFPYISKLAPSSHEWQKGFLDVL